MIALQILVAVLLGVLALAFVCYPLYRHAPAEIVHRRASSSIATTQAELEQAARTAIKEVELDYQLGNLAETDYRTWRDRYTRRAFTAMKSRQASEEEIDALIEERLRQFKAQREETPEEHETVTPGDDDTAAIPGDAMGKDDDANA